MSRILSPPVNHPITYGKFVMDKYTKTENILNIFINGFPSFQIPYFPKRLIIDKKELIFDKEEEILSLRLRDFLSENQGEICEPLSINQEDSP